MADQCIVCLEILDSISAETDSKAPQLKPECGQAALNTFGDDPCHGHNGHLIAVIQTCGHILHDACLQAWIEKANSCPICRSAFHLVEVRDKVGGKSHMYLVCTTSTDINIREPPFYVYRRG